MTSIEVFSLSGFFFGVVLHAYLFSIAVQQRRKGAFEWSLIGLLVVLQLWYVGSFLSLLLRQMDVSKVEILLMVLESVALAGLVTLPGLLLHVHWIYYRNFHVFAAWEKWAITSLLVLLYAQLLGLPAAFDLMWPPAADVSPLQRLQPLTGSFLMLLGVSYYACCFLQIRMLKQPKNAVEKAVFKRLFVIFLVIPIFNFYAFFPREISEKPLPDQWPIALAQVSSIVPALVIAYYIYRHRFLLIVPPAFTRALAILLVLGFYLIGVRQLVEFLQETLSAPASLVEGTLLVAILLLFLPLSRWLENLSSSLFSGRLKQYRELTEAVSRIPSGQLNANLMIELMQDKLRMDLGASHVRIRPGETATPRAGTYPLQAGGRKLGLLEIHFDDLDPSPAEQEALKLLASEIGASLERLQLLESKLRMEREVARKSQMEDLGQMTATVAHNVKNPLSSIKTLMQLLAEADNLTPEQKGEIDMVIKEIERLASTVSDLLHSSQAGSGRVSRRAPQNSVAEVIQFLKWIFRGDLESHQLLLETRLEQGLPPAKDPEALLEILSNLLTNAIEASPEGSKIVVSATQSEAVIQLCIEDQGPGIPGQIRERLFEPFVTTRPGGTGLGLAIARKRVEQLGGTLTFTSPVANDRGTLFVVSLPHTSSERKDPS